MLPDTDRLQTRILAEKAPRPRQRGPVSAAPVKSLNPIGASAFPPTARRTEPRRKNLRTCHEPSSSPSCVSTDVLSVPEKRPGALKALRHRYVCGFTYISFEA